MTSSIDALKTLNCNRNTTGLTAHELHMTSSQVISSFVNNNSEKSPTLLSLDKHERYVKQDVPTSDSNFTPHVKERIIPSRKL